MEIRQLVAASKLLNTIRLIAGGFLIAIAPGSQGHASNLKNCIAQVVEVDVGNSKSYETALRDLIVREAPQYDELAGINWELQSGLVEKRQREIQYLLFTDPERLDVKHTVFKLINFDWNELDTFRMARVAPEYKALTARLEDLQLRNNNHSDWQALRTFVTTTLVGNADYKSLLIKLQKGQKFADTLFKDCKGN